MPPIAGLYARLRRSRIRKRRERTREGLCEWSLAPKLALRPHEIAYPVGRAARNLAVQEITVPLHESLRASR